MRRRCSRRAAPRLARPPAATLSHAPPHTHTTSTTPYNLLREAAETLAILVSRSKRLQTQLLVTVANAQEPRGGEPESMPERLWARLMRTCGDYMMQARSGGGCWVGAEGVGTHGHPAPWHTQSALYRPSRAPPDPPCSPAQRALLELLYYCGRGGRPELHARYLPEPELAAAFDELLEKPPGVGGRARGGVCVGARAGPSAGAQRVGRATRGGGRPSPCPIHFPLRTARLPAASPSTCTRSCTPSWTRTTLFTRPSRGEARAAAPVGMRKHLACHPKRRLATAPARLCPCSVTTLALQSADLGLQVYVPHPRQGHRLLLGRGHLSLAVCRVRLAGRRHALRVAAHGLPPFRCVLLQCSPGKAGSLSVKSPLPGHTRLTPKLPRPALAG